MILDDLSSGVMVLCNCILHSWMYRC